MYISDGHFKLGYMKRILCILLCLFTTFVGYGQVGIGTDVPKTMLDVKATNTPNIVDGILIPRISKQRASEMNNVEESTLIYIDDISTGPNTGAVEFVESTGYYYFQGGQWVNLPNKNEVIKLNFWKLQPTSTTNSARISARTTDDPLDNYEYDIFQKGKVGIGYDDRSGINFQVNSSQKQLEVGGDFRTSYFNSSEEVFYGIETNSIALPSNYASRGNVLFTAKSKNLEDYSYFNKVYDGSMILQSQDKINFFSRMNTNSNANAAEFRFNSEQIVGLIAKGVEQNNINHFLLDKNEFRVAENSNTNARFGLDFIKDKFYIGNISDSGMGYYFPNQKGTEGQILQLNADNDLEWKYPSNLVGATAAPKFFYMPSIVLPINGTSTQYVTYNASNQTYTVDLYAAFKAQFDTPIKSSNGSASGLQGFVLPREAYEYHIIYADNSVFPHTDINFSTEAGQEGKFTYKVNPATIVNGAAFMNIVLKVK